MNGLDTLAVTKLDVLDPCHSVLVGVGYRYKGTTLHEWPSEERVVEKLEPVFEERPGWLSETAGLRAWEELPARAHDYLRWLADLIECEISLVSTGPGPRRDDPRRAVAPDALVSRPPPALPAVTHGAKAVGSATRS